MRGIHYRALIDGLVQDCSISIANLVTGDTINLH